MIPVTERGALELRIETAKKALDTARKEGDKLSVSLVEDALNHLLDQYASHTCNR